MKHKDGSIVVRLHVVGWAMFVPSWMSHTADKPNAVLADLIQLDRGEPYVMFCLVGLILLAISFVNRLKNRSVLFIKGEDGTGTGEINKEALRALFNNELLVGVRCGHLSSCYSYLLGITENRDSF
jgi:hypothetical protein